MAEGPAELARANAKLRKINRVLMERVERSIDAQGGAFSLFQAAITLEKTVDERTRELQIVNAQLRDEIIERKAVEAALDASKESAERANDSKTKFLAAASHDLLQPLNSARLFADALAERLDDGTNAALAQRIRASLESAESLLASLLEMSRFDAGAMTVDVADFALGPLLRRLRDEYAIVAEERDLRLRVLDSAAIVHTDPLLLERMLRNLLGNALRYTRTGGVLVGCRHRPGAVAIEVWDTGIGIAPEKLDEIFEEFRRLATPVDSLPGLGLGLAIVERISRLLALPVSVRSRPGRGTVFAVEVPLGRRVGLSPAPGIVAAPRAPLQGKTVLVVDDDAVTLDGMTLLLRGWGCRTLGAPSVERAVDACRPLRDGVDFVIADYNLGGATTGLDALGRVAGLQRRPFGAVVVTADRTTAVRQRIIERGYLALAKPVHAKELLSLMSSILA